MSASDSGKLFDLRCAVCERMIDYLDREHPQAGPGEAAQWTHSPGAEDISEADREALRARSAAAASLR